jgi:periplasmic copper chaperone A
MPIPFHKGLLIALALSAATAGAALAQDYMAGSIKVSQVWSREVPPASKVAGGFMTITNTGSEPDTLIGGSVAVAGKFEVHEMTMTDGVMKMRELKPGLVIKPGETVVLKPGSFHVMMMGLKEPLKAGKPIKGTLIFQKAGKIDVTYKVEPFGTKVPGDGGQAIPRAGMDMKGNADHAHH